MCTFYSGLINKTSNQLRFGPSLNSHSEIYSVCGIPSNLRSNWIEFDWGTGRSLSVSDPNNSGADLAAVKARLQKQFNSRTALTQYLATNKASIANTWKPGANAGSAWPTTPRVRAAVKVSKVSLSPGATVTQVNSFIDRIPVSKLISTVASNRRILSAQAITRAFSRLKTLSQRLQAMKRWGIPSGAVSITIRPYVFAQAKKRNSGKLSAKAV